MTTPDNTAATERAVQAAAPKKAPKTFLQTVQDIHYGHFADECTAELQKCISESERTGKVTELTIKLKIKPVGKAGRYEIHNDVTSKLPPKEREAALMFVGPDMNLQNNDPRQREIEGLRVVDGPSPGKRVTDEDQQGGIRVAS